MADRWEKFTGDYTQFYQHTAARYEPGTLYFDTQEKAQGASPTGMGLLGVYDPAQGDPQHGHTRWRGQLYEGKGDKIADNALAGRWEVRQGDQWVPYEGGSVNAPTTLYPRGTEFGKAPRSGTTKEFLAGSSKVDWNPLAKRR